MAASATDDLIRNEADLIRAGLTLQFALQNLGLELLRAQLQALDCLLPGAKPPPATDAEVEAGFDNMPV